MSLLESLVNEGVVRALYRALLCREPDPAGMASFCKLISQPGGLEKALRAFINSEEFHKLHNKEAVVFLHIAKTGGSSLHKILSVKFGPKAYLEHADSLSMRTASQLRLYDVFAGHFNYDSLSYLPYRKFSIFTFVREPKARLLSHYYYYRSHEPGIPTWDDLMKLANELDLEKFLENNRVKKHGFIWNHMTWAIMGAAQWLEWHTLLTGEADKGRIQHVMETTVRPAIRRRLREFTFVGLQEDYDRSLEMLFQRLEWKLPPSIPRENSLEQRIEENPWFKPVDKQSMTPRLDALLDQYVQLDRVVYDEAKLLYADRLEEHQRKKSAHVMQNRKDDSDISIQDLEEQKIVFLRLPRAGGRTLHNLLLPYFTKEVVFPERFNRLRYFSGVELARFRFFSGYFDLPSTLLIPGRKRIIALFRDPVARLVSLYRFLRAHPMEVIEQERLYLARLANQYTMADFFRTEEVRSHFAINNAISRTLTQFTEGKRWEAAASLKNDEAPNLDLALKELTSLDAFGIVERYDESIALIFSTIGLPIPRKIEKNQASHIIVEQQPGLRKVDEEPVSEESRSLIAELVRVDMELYKEACKIFEERLATMKSKEHAARC